jgi:hypothetical protein
LRAGSSDPRFSKKSTKNRKSTAAPHQRHFVAQPAQRRALASMALAPNVVDARLNTLTLAIVSTPKRSTAATSEALLVSRCGPNAGFCASPCFGRDGMTAFGARNRSRAK